MALIQCPECGEDVSDKAPVCVHCGYPLERQSTDINKNSGDIVANLVLVSVGDEIRTLKRLCNVTGLGLAQVKEMMDSVPQTILINKKYKEVVACASQLQQLGCIVDIIDSSSGSGESTNHYGVCGIGAIQCPDCSSTDVLKLATSSSRMFRSFRRKVQDSYKCNCCGFKW